MDLNNKYKNQPLKDLIALALENTQSTNLEQIAAKRRILKKIADNNSPTFTSEEVVMIKTACMAKLIDGATIAVIEEIAPQDFE